MTTHAAPRPPGGRPPNRSAEASRAQRLAEPARLVAWTAGLLVIARVVHDMGDNLHVPLGSATELIDWLTIATPVEMAAGGLRLAAIAATWYLLATTAITVVADRAGWRGIARVVQQVSPAVVQRVALRGGGVGLAIGSLLGAAAPTGIAPITVAAVSAAPMPEATATGVGGAATMVRLADPAQPLADTELGAASRATSGTATMTALDDLGPSPVAEAAGHATMIRLSPTLAPVDPTPSSPIIPDTPADGPDGPEGADAADAADPTATGADEPDHSAPGDDATPTWTVQPGDSLWSIAAEVVSSDGAGHVLTDAEITPYWHTLIEANRGRLAVPDNPDLLIPGQQLVVPEPSAG